MRLSSKVGIVVALIALALSAPFTLTWPTHDVAPAGLSVALSGRMLLELITMGLAWVGTDAIVRSNPKAKSQQLRLPFLWSILPTAVTTAAWLLLARLPNLADRVAGIAASAAALTVLITAEYWTAGPMARWPRALGIFLQFATYAVAAMLYGAVHVTLLGVHVARAGTLVAAILALRLLGEDGLPLGRVLCVSAGIGFLLGAVCWQLQAWIASPVAYSLTLVVLLYVLAGLAGHYLHGKLRREVVLEYLLVGLVALALIFLAR